MKRHMTLKVQNQKLLKSSPSNYTFTQAQHEIENSSSNSDEYKFEDQVTPPHETEAPEANYNSGPLETGFEEFRPYHQAHSDGEDNSEP